MKIIFINALSILGFVAAYTETPIIGVLSQESYSVDKYFPGEKYKSFIAASYVKLLESSGARVVPIWIGQNKDYYRKVVESTNGVLFPGGSVLLSNDKGYADAAQYLYDLALEMNRKGDYYPIYAICLGMELLPLIVSGGADLRTPCKAKKLKLPLKFKKSYKSSKLFGKLPSNILDIMKNQNVLYHNHGYCITEDAFREFGLNSDWKVLATNKDEHGLEFISAFESKKYPFYALQFHPEKSPYEFKLGMGFPHSMDAILGSQYFGNFFVSETRKNNHSFPGWDVEQKSLIYNYSPRFIGIQNSSYTQVYMFKKSDFVWYA